MTLIGFSFDDGRRDTYTLALPILRRYGLPATVNVTTGYVTGETAQGNPTWREAMTPDMVREMAADPLIEIAGHGHRHQNNEQDIAKGISRLHEMTGRDRLTALGDGFASPGTGLDRAAWHGGMRQRLMERGIRYARLSLRLRTRPRLRTLARKAARVLHLPALYAYAYHDTLMSSAEDGLLYSIPVLRCVTVAELMAVVRTACRGGGIKTAYLCCTVLQAPTARTTTGTTM